MKINWSQKIFIYWVMVVGLSVLAQWYLPGKNIGIVFAVLFVPIFIHDILVNLVLDSQNRRKEKSK